MLRPSSIDNKQIPSIVAIIPCFNAGYSIVDVVTKAKRHANKVVVVDDGSLDNTNKMAELATASIIKHENNLGKGAAMKTAAQYAHEDIIVFLDGDGQHNPDDIPKLIEPIILRGFDAVIGSRHLQGSKILDPIFRRRLVNVLASIAIYVITNLFLPLISLLRFRIHVNLPKMGTKNFGPQNNRPRSKRFVTDCTSGFRAIRRQCWQELDLLSNGFEIEAEMIYEIRKNRFILTEVPISCNWNSNVSHLSIVKDGWRTLKLLIKKLLVDIKVNKKGNSSIYKSNAQF